MDKLDTLFALQESFQKDLIARRGLEGISMEEWLQRQTLALLSEMAELLNEVNFKWWKNPRPVNDDNVRDELVDMLHFFLSMCLSAGLTPDELFERYLRKNKINFDRQRGLAGEGYQSPEPEKEAQ